MAEWGESVDPLGPGVIGIANTDALTDAAIVGSDLQALLVGDGVSRTTGECCLITGCCGSCGAMADHHFGSVAHRRRLPRP
ncbi:MAG: hypothetical protein CM15mP18_4240 [Methanobacteriota archaeon]|nr:MAG: hypothetical protein CM15mP18_4240 [Euryarchaeota archaeon]